MDGFVDWVTVITGFFQAALGCVDIRQVYSWYGHIMWGFRAPLKVRGTGSLTGELGFPSRGVHVPFGLI